MGLRPAKYRRAIVSFTIATRRLRAVSASVNSRPATSGIPTVAK